MPAATRQNDKCSGHDGFDARPAIEGSPNVFINGRPAHRQGNKWDTHCNALTCHDGTLAAGSRTVFVNGKPLGRVGDPVDCGSTVAEGSPNVFAG